MMRDNFITFIAGLAYALMVVLLGFGLGVGALLSFRLICWLGLL